MHPGLKELDEGDKIYNGNNHILFFFIMGMFQYGFAEILENLASMRKKTEEQLFYLNAAVNRLAAPPTQSTPEINSGTASAE